MSKENHFSGGTLYMKEISLNIILTLRIKDVFIVVVFFLSCQYGCHMHYESALVLLPCKNIRVTF